MAEAAAAAPAEGAPAPSKLSPALLVVALNSLVLLGALGYLYYTRVMFKRPEITESTERERLEKQHQKKVTSLKPGLLDFEAMTINIKPADSERGAASSKLHYVTLAFSLETREEDLVEGITPFKPRIIDKVISLVGRKGYFDLVTVQGRYLLRTQITDGVNELLESLQKKKNEDWDAPLTNVYFTQFTVQ